MTDITDTVNTYIDMWNETDPAARAELIARAWAEDAHYVDPLLEASGHDGLDAMVAGVHEQYPGHRFALTSGVDAHHSLIRFGWELAGPDGVLVAGTDVGIVTEDGRLQRIAGFFGEVPALTAA